MIRYPYSRPDVRESDLAPVMDVLRSGWLTQGPTVPAFEAELQETLGCRYAVAVSSATAALHLVYHAVGVSRERGLITSPVTFLATANAARYCGAPVSFTDVDPETGNMTPEGLDDALRKCEHPVAAVTAVHLAGRPCDMVGLQAVADSHGVVLLEDACHAPLATYVDGDGGLARVGQVTHSRAATISFHAIKHIATGEGGAVLTNDPEIAEVARRLRSHGIVKGAERFTNAPEPDAPWYYEMLEMGWNYRMSDIHAALGRTQLGRLAPAIEERRRLVGRYDAALSNLNWLDVPVPPPMPEGHAWHLYPVAIDFRAIGMSRGAVMRRLADLGIGTQVHYIPLYRQPYYRDLGAVHLPGAEAYYARTLSLPLYPGLPEEAVDEICHNISALAGTA